LISPTGTIAKSTPTYKWEVVNGATLYRISVYSVDTSSYVVTDNIAATLACSVNKCEYTPSVVLEQANYRFFVRGRNRVGWGPISDWMKYRYGTPDVPTLISPSGTIVTNTPTYQWEIAEGASVYRISVFSIDAAEFVITDNVKAVTYCSGEVCEYTPATELIQGNYRFKVRAHNAVGWGPISDWMKFRYGTPDAPTIISPSGVIVTNTPTYQWDKVDGASVYKISVYSIDAAEYVITDNVKAVTYCSGVACEYTPPTELIQGNYMFKVRAHNAVGWGPISTWMSFKYGPPDAPTPISPNGTIVTNTPTYKWSNIQDICIFD
jgi:hypothetical protein